MPLRDDLLNPIPGANPSGEYLYYAPIYDKIKEARREDDEGPAGDWTRERKVADWNLVIKLAGEALASKSKDLQLAAWLSEAYLKKEGFGTFRESLDMITQLLERFWDTLYPEIEDGDAEFRATPISWLGNFDLQIRMSPITRSGYTVVDYTVSRKVGYKADTEGDEQKLAAYNEKIAEGKISADQYDSDIDRTPKQNLVAIVENMQGCLDSLENLQMVCEVKFGDDAPGFTKLRKALEETLNTAKIILNKKREKDPDAPQPPSISEPEPEPEPQYSYGASAAAAPAPAAATPVRKKTGPLAAEPQDADDAIGRIVSAARFLRAQEPYSPAPFLLLAGFRFGELRASGESIDPSRLEAPPTDLRQQIKKASIDADWTSVLNAAEEALALPCGRGWLDLHRYASRACTEFGYSHDGFRKGIISTVRGVLQDYPTLPKLTMLDDTPTANSETQDWLNSEVLTGGGMSSGPALPAMPVQSAAAGSDGSAPPDAWDLAQQAMRGGRVREAVELIDREARMERSGRGRFLRKTQLARIFIDSGNEPLAMPILEQLNSEIETRQLEDWEPTETIAHPLTLLYRCLANADRESEAARKLYNKLCRLDPLAAMGMLR
jgi:type VI secretion system protein ImpA